MVSDPENRGIQPRSTDAPRRTNRGSLGAGGHAAFAVALILHAILGAVALVIAVVTALNDNLTTNERLEVRQGQLGIAVVLWLAAAGALILCWATGRRLGLVAAVIWAAVGLPLAVFHASVETIPPPAACDTSKRFTVGRVPAAPDFPPPIAWCHETDDPIRAVATGAGTVYAALDDGRLLALDGTGGTELWVTEPGAATGALVAEAGVVYAAADTAITAWSEAGEVIWTAPLPGRAESFATDETGALYAAVWDSGGGIVVAIERATGVERWWTPYGNSGDTLFAASGMVYSVQTDPTLSVAVHNADDGRRDPHYWTYDPGARTYLTPATLIAGTLVIGTETLGTGDGPTTGAIVGLDPATGSVRWTRQIDVIPSLAPASGGGSTVLLETGGRLFRLDAATGEPLAPELTTESSGFSDIRSGRLLVPDGEIVYTTQIRASASEDVAFNGIVTATAPAGGALWWFHLGNGRLLPVIPGDGLVYIPDGQGLFAIVQARLAATPTATSVQ